MLIRNMAANFKKLESVVIAVVLMVFSAAVIFALGVIHLIYTFWGSKLTPRDTALQIAMTQISPVLTKETTMWRAWVGFNASHSMGAMLFGVIYGFLAIAHGQLLFQSWFLLATGLAMLGGLLVLGKAYWFSIPFTGIGVALASFVVGIIASRG